MIHEQIVDYMNEYKISLEDLGKSIFAQFVSSAIVGVIEWWFAPSASCSAEELSERLWSLLDANWKLLLSPQT